MPDDLSLLTELVLTLEHLQNVDYVHVSTISLLLYEYFITLHLEVRYIWNARWGFMKIVYLITRYLPFVDTTLNLIRHFYPHLSAKACHNLFSIITWLILAGMAISEVIFTLRTWAVWGKKRWLTISLPIYYSLFWAAAFLVAGIAIKTVKFGSQDFVERGCVMTEGNSTLIAIEWALLLKYDIVIMILMLIPAFITFKRHGMSQLTKAVYKDGIIYYTYLFVFSLANLLVGVILTRDYFDIILTMGRVFRASLACRVVLRMRELGQKQQWNEEESYYAHHNDARFIT